MKKKMKLIGSLGCMLLGLGMLSVPAFAVTDYSTMTTEELAAMRGTMRETTQEDREAFRNEWQARVNTMSQEERQQATGRPENSLRDGAGNKYGKGKGQGQGGSQHSWNNAGSSGNSSFNDGSRGGGRSGGRGGRR